MTYETKTTRTMHGAIKCETVVPLGPVAADYMGEAGQRVLVLATMKGYSALSSHASVCIERPSATSGYTSRQHAVFGDYSATIAKPAAGTRATEKNVRALHETALALLPAIVARCMAHYYPEALASREGEAAHA